MTLKEKLLARLPIKYRDRVVDLTEECDLIDNCKYLLHYSLDYTDGDCAGSTIPVRSINEAISFVKFLMPIDTPINKNTLLCYLPVKYWFKVVDFRLNTYNSPKSKYVLFFRTGFRRNSIGDMSCAYFTNSIQDTIDLIKYLYKKGVKQ